MRHGFQSIGASIGVLVEEKNKAYGDSFAQSGKVLRILYPDGVKPDQYDDFLAVTRVIDKLFRIATRKDALGESPWKDISGYGILGVANDEQKGISQMEHEPICFVCKKKASEIKEYVESAHWERITPSEYVREEDGTFNRESNQFCCTSCYIDIGMPTSPNGWKAP
jgi:hypothetical protein